MEEFGQESYTPARIGLGFQTTTFIVKRTFGNSDLLDLYTDYVVEKLREDLRKRKDQPSTNADREKAV
ncbi:MAG: hypothetical protein IKQ92_03445 [Clostridia bacterium]|nr:hypothetical protein [Clostridia bacterium]